MGFQEVTDKLRWTQHHFNILNTTVTDYLDPKNTGFFIESYDETKTMAWGRFDPLSGIPPTHIAHIFGDVIQSANSCLDYLVAELFGRYNNGEPSKVFHEFPIVDEHRLFNEKIGKGALFGIPFEAVAVIESLQPYQGRTDPVNSNLATLRRLTNEHKHRKVRVAVLTASAAPSNPAAIIERDGEVYVLAEALPKATHFKAKIGPFPVKDGKVEVNGKFTAVIVLEESGLRDIHLPLLAGKLCDAVSEVCERIKPFFA